MLTGAIVMIFIGVVADANYGIDIPSSFFPLTNLTGCLRPSIHHRFDLSGLWRAPTRPGQANQCRLPEPLHGACRILPAGALWGHAGSWLAGRGIWETSDPFTPAHCTRETSGIRWYDKVWPQRFLHLLGNFE